MNWTYISPHLDDAAFSCGGLVWEQTSAGEKVSIWTIFAGDPPQGTLSDFAEKLQTRWRGGRESMSFRRQEDIQACERIGASYRQFPFPDCIYRGAYYPLKETEGKQENGAPAERIYFYTSHDSLFGSIHPAEIGLATLFSQMLADLLPDQMDPWVTT
jgi:LmbE family N-acetylglucosaminyl deacetylase